MDRRKRAAPSGTGGTGGSGRASGAGISGERVDSGACVVCGHGDARMLVPVSLEGGVRAILCGSHALLHARLSEPCRSTAELKDKLGERRYSSRRAPLGRDELAEQLTEAFTRDRRTAERRAG